MLDLGTRATLPARAARAHMRPCGCCGAGVEEDAQVAALHLIQACPRASDAAFAAAVQALLEMRQEAVDRAVQQARAGGAAAKGQETAARQVRLAWEELLGPVVTGLLDRAQERPWAAPEAR